MRIKHARPMNFSGISSIMTAVAFFLILVPMRVWKLWPLTLLGWFLLFASWGTSVEVKEDVLVLRYFFGKLQVKIPLCDIDEVKVINRLERATLVGHFPWMAALFLTVILYAFVNFIMLPSDMLRGYYYGYMGLFVLGMAYLGAWALPFRKGLYIRLFAVFLIVFGVFLIRIKTGDFEDYDGFLMFTWGFIVFLGLEEYYNTDYVLIKSAGKSYLIAVEGERETLLEAISNVETP